MGLGGEHHQVLDDALQVGDLAQHGELPVLRQGGASAPTGQQQISALPPRPPALTTTGCRKVMKVQKRPRSSMRALRTACFSVSSSSRYMSLTSCSALSSWGCRSPFPVRQGYHQHRAPPTPPTPNLLGAGSHGQPWPLPSSCCEASPRHRSSPTPVPQEHPRPAAAPERRGFSPTSPSPSLVLGTRGAAAAGLASPQDVGCRLS